MRAIAGACGPGTPRLDRAMIEEVADISPQGFASWDAMIDVRSPAEFAADKIPGAVNLPVLDDHQRAEIGAIYTRQSRFQARRLGAALIARNVARHLETALSDKDARFRPLLYCWRGGMRSHAMATILSGIGWRAGVLRGGYRTWRRAVVASLSDATEPLQLVLVDGQTGTAKTEILGRLQAMGVETIDLEGLAAHKGSVFGADASRPQPTQKFFESLLHDRLSRIDRRAPIAVEAESARIGRLVVPKRLWRAMREAPRIEIAAGAAARADYLVRAYAEIIAAPGRIEAAIEKLRPFHAKETIERWLSLAGAERHDLLAEQLMREHYDPLYERSRKRSDGSRLGVIRLDGLETGDLDRAAREAAALIGLASKASRRE